MVRILDVVGQFTGFPVKPHIAHHAVLGRKGSCCQGGVADNGFGVGILIVGIGVIDALSQQVVKSSLAKTGAVAVDQISTQAIDGNL